MSIPLASTLTDAQQALAIAGETKNYEDIEIAIDRWWSILRSTKKGDEECVAILSSYASALILRWKMHCRAEDVDTAITTLENSVQIQGDSATPARYENYYNLGSAYLDRWEVLKQEPSNLLMAAERWETAYSIATELGRPQESTVPILIKLGDMYSLAYSHNFSDISAISLAIERYSEALSVATPEASPKLRYKLGKMHATLFLETSEHPSLQLGLSCLEESIASDLPNEDKEEASMHLSAIYSLQYNQTKARDLLDSAILWGLWPLQVLGVDHWACRAVQVQGKDARARLLRDAAASLCLLYKDFGDAENLDIAINCHELAQLLPGSNQDEDLATFYYNHGIALTLRSSIANTPQERVKADLKQAVELLQLAVDNAESKYFLDYEGQLQTVLERYHTIHEDSPDSPHCHDDRLSTTPSPSPSAISSDIFIIHQPSTTPETADQVQRFLISQPTSEADLDNAQSNESSPSAALPTRPHVQAVDYNETPNENQGESLPGARHLPLQHPTQVSADAPQHPGQSTVEVWDILEAPAQPLNSRLANTDTESSDSETFSIRSLSETSSATSVSPMGAGNPLPLERERTQWEATKSSVSIPPSPEASPHAQFATILGMDASAPTVEEFPQQIHRNSPPHNSAAALPVSGIKRRGILSQNSIHFEPDVLTQPNEATEPRNSSPPNQWSPVDILLATVETRFAIESSRRATSRIELIRPTNLTGQVVKGEHPVDEGGFSSIYQGDFKSNKVAIKVIRCFSAVDSTTLRKRLRREMDVWWKLDHPNVIPLWGYINNTGPLPSMISPWYENGNASKYVKRKGLGLELRFQLLREVCSGLRYLHHFGPPVVHGDLKPGNILIDNAGIARLCDFGLARLVVTDAEPSITTVSVGTIRYAAPELRNPQNDDGRISASTETDIYSLACIAYEFLYQKLPFSDKPNNLAIIKAGYSHIPPANKAMEDQSVLGPTTPHYWELFESCWDEIPSQRPDISSFCEHIDLALFAFAN